MQRASVVVLLVVTAIIGGCHHHHRPSGEAMVVGFVAPEYRGKPVRLVLVTGRVGKEKMYLRDQVERRLVSQIQRESHGQTSGVTSLQLMPPIRDYSSSEVDVKIKEAGVDAVMFVNAGSDVQTSQGWGFSFDSYGGGGGSYSNSARFTNVTVEMYDPKNKAIMWKAEGDIRVSGGNQKSIDQTSEFLAEKVARLLRRDGLYPASQGSPVDSKEE